jgi:hypothetical protein
VTPDHPWDVRSYLRSNANFPTTTTLAQLYDGAEFEAYRAMGEKTGQDVLAASKRADSPAEDRTPQQVADAVAFPRPAGALAVNAGGRKVHRQGVTQLLRLRLYRLAEGRGSNRI